MLGPLGKVDSIPYFLGALIGGSIHTMRSRAVEDLKQQYQSEEYLMVTKLVETVNANGKHLEKLMQSVEFLVQKAESELHSQNAGKAPV